MLNAAVKPVLGGNGRYHTLTTGVRKLLPSYCEQYAKLPAID
jgi:hypothetical protein